jgi:hypothetical protein
VLGRALAVLACVVAAQARATTVFPASGGQLTLGNSYTVASPSIVGSGAVTVNDLTPNGTSSYFYGHGWGAAQAVIPQAIDGTTTTYSFYDDIVFTVSDSSANDITSTISLSSGATNTSIINLSARLYALAGNGTLPGFPPEPVAGTIWDVWSTNTVLSPNSTASVVVIPDSVLPAATYVLELRGDVNGSGGGSYSGTLNVNPVPLPAGLPLLTCGIGILGGWVRRRTRNAR